MPDGEDLQHTATAVDVVDDSEAPYPISPQAFQLPLQGFAELGIGTQRAHGLSHAPFHFWRQTPDDRRDEGRELGTHQRRVRRFFAA